MRELDVTSCAHAVTRLAQTALLQMPPCHHLKMAAVIAEIFYVTDDMPQHAM